MRPQIPTAAVVIVPMPSLNTARSKPRTFLIACVLRRSVFVIRAFVKMRETLLGTRNSRKS